MKIWATELKELEVLNSSMKDHFADLEKEMERLISADDENMVLLYSRRCLEVIITDLCECELKRPRKTEPLKGIIDKLNQEEKVPSYIIASMHSLNSLSTFGAHPKEFDPEQVKPVLLNLTTVIKWYLKYMAEKAEAEEKEKLQGAGYKVQPTGDKVQGTGEKLQVTGYKVQGGESQEGRPSDIDTNLKEIKESHQISKSGKKPYMIISGILVIAVLLYIVFDQFHFFRKDKFEDVRGPDGKISIAVMPFENQTGDTTLNWFQRGISSLIINGLGNSSELTVLDDQTMFEVIESMDQVYTAGISPSVAREVAKKVKAETYISGSFQGREDTYWILVNLVNTENGNIIWTNKVEGNLKSSGYLDMADSLCNEIKNYLEIKALENVADYDFREAYPKSAEAYRYFIEGMNLVLNQNYESGIQSLKKALEIDSTFTFASFYIAYAYTYNNQWEPSVLWTKKTYLNKDRVPPKYQLWIDLWYSCYFNKNPQEIGRYCDLLAESGINTRLFWSDLGATYFDFLQQYEKAIGAYEKVMEINIERGSEWKFLIFWDRFIIALHKVGNHEREKEISDIALSVLPNNSNWFYYRMAICALSQGKTSEANEVLVKYRAKHKELGTPEKNLELYLGQMYEQANIMEEAEMHFRKAYELNPQSNGWIGELARFLIYNDINVDEGMELIPKGLENWPEDEYLLQLEGWGLYKQGKYEESVQLLSEMWDKTTGFNTELYNHLNEAKQALTNQKQTK
jgi:TolB-like protein